MEAHAELKASERILLKWQDLIIALITSDHPQLTSRQMAVLMSVSLYAAPQTVRGLAVQLQVGKPAISRALDRLSQLQLVERAADLHDRRGVCLRTTEAGWAFLDSIAEQLTASFS